VTDPSNAPSIAGLRVLVVEDNADTREVLTLSLGMVGAQVTGAASVDEAVGADLTAFDVAITDLSMPGRNGYDLLRAAHEGAPALPIIAVSGYSKQQEQERGGAPDTFAGYLTKPVDHAELVKTIHHVVHTSRPGQSL
jgi:CheY-like chemotaxis protein